MDKTKLRGSSKTILFAVFVIIALLVSGCETTKGLVAGIGSTAKSTAKGIGKDSYNFWNFIKKTDDWTRKTLW